MSYPNAAFCPPAIKESLKRYALGIPTGGFVRAVLENNLSETIARADTTNLGALIHIVAYCYDMIPAASWGSPQKVATWLDRKRAPRDAVEAAQ